MTKTLNVMAIQMSSVIGEKEKNIDKISNLIEKNIRNNTDIMFLPEVWTVGWDCEYFKDSAEDLKNSSVIDFLSSIARKNNVNIVGGSFITKQDGKLFNTCPVINRDGNLIATYNKCHLFSYYGDTEGTYITRGENPVIVNIEGVKIGLSICYDIRFPEIYRAYAKNNVDLMVNMAAWPMTREIHWVSLTHARAIENQSYFIALTQSGQLSNGELNLGKSFIIDYKGEDIDAISQGEGAIFANLNFDEEYSFRKKCTVLKDVHDNYKIKEIQQ
ncbi:hypothetical protein IJG72_05795 [bacterium]|nr:hypothetical protein [bacterium]